jgi:hypothetical protein
MKRAVKLTQRMDGTSVVGIASHGNGRSYAIRLFSPSYRRLVATVGLWPSEAVILDDAVQSWFWEKDHEYEQVLPY